MTNEGCSVIRIRKRTESRSSSTNTEKFSLFAIQVAFFFSSCLSFFVWFQCGTSLINFKWFERFHHKPPTTCHGAHSSTDSKLSHLISSVDFEIRSLKSTICATVSFQKEVEFRHDRSTSQALPSLLFLNASSSNSHYRNHFIANRDLTHSIKRLHPGPPPIEALAALRRKSYKKSRAQKPIMTHSTVVSKI